MLYYVKSFVKGIAKNGRPYYKLSLVGEDGNAVSATCFSTLEYDPGDFVGGVIVSNLSPSDQFPKVTDSELATIRPLTGSIPEAFKKFVNPMDAINGTGARQIQKAYPIIRYAEILLSYAEALNNLTGSHTVELDGKQYTLNRNK